MRNTVENLVPSDVLLYLGIYIETWAHIELRLWRIILSVQQCTPDPVTITVKDLKVRSKNWLLIRDFRKCRIGLPPALSVQIEALAVRVSSGTRNRNFAAHGAVYHDATRQELRVAHYYSEGERTDKRWYEVDSAIRIQQIRSEVSNANQLLLDLIDLSAQITDYLSPSPR